MWETQTGKASEEGNHWTLKSGRSWLEDRVSVGIQGLSSSELLEMLCRFDRITFSDDKCQAVSLEIESGLMLSAKRLRLSSWPPIPI